MKNLVNVIREQPEVIAISDIAALKLGPECYRDVAKLSKKATILEQEGKSAARVVRDVARDVKQTKKRFGILLG